MVTRVSMVEASDLHRAIARDLLARMERTPVESNSLRSLGYDAETRTLEVEFQSGRIYLYSEVPQSTFTWLMRSKSKGGIFNRMIKDVYPWKDVTPSPYEDRDLAADLERSLKR